MRRFANLYIVLFLIDAGLSLLDELFAYYDSSMPLITGLRFPIAVLVILLSTIIYACLGIDRRLPKRVFLPMTAYAFWCSVGLWPLSGAISHGALGLAASVGQVIVAGFAVILVQGLCGRMLLTELHFQREMFSLGNTLGFTAINLLLTPVLLVFSLLALTGSYLEQQTAGFLRLSPIGIYMSERSYHRGEKVIRLAGMMHIGKEDYFEDIAGSMSTGGTIILAEGVTDRDGLLKSQYNYNRLAGIVGLTSQEAMRIDANMVNLDIMEEGEELPAKKTIPDLAQADIDLNRFEPSTVEFINVLGRTLLSERPLAETFLEYNAWVDANMTPDEMAAVMHDIIDKRNRVIIDNLARTLPFYDTVIIPWGAMHMPAIEDAVLEKGFRAGESKERLSLDFRTLPYADMWKKWVANIDKAH